MNLSETFRVLYQINLRNYAVRWLLLQEYNTMHGHLNIKNRNILKYTRTSPDRKTPNQTDHILVDRRRRSSLLDVQCFRRPDCDTDHFLVTAKLRERLAVSKQETRKFDVE